MIKKLRGVVRGRTVEFAEDLGVPDGQEVDFEMQVNQESPSREKMGWLRLEGILADDPEWDEIMEEVYQQRKLQHRPQMEDFGECDS